MDTARSAILGVLLAGGRSERMGGGDKCLAPLAGRPLLAHAVERLRTHTRTAGCVGLQTHKEPALRILRLDAPGFVEWQAASHQIGDEY